ncbi:hypothetical protein FC35_GL000233 [Limosilactobacillus coleohominis DSM 14060]|nr:hypothetical protein FC35_GL000233 [Limosilactobacillus coleohominis DSM 14060]
MVITHHIEWITEQTQKIYDRIKQMYELEKDIDDNEDATIPELTVKKCPSKQLNYQTYRWTIEVINDLQLTLNKLVGFYNSVNFVNIDDYSNTSTFRLWIPFEKELNTEYYQHLQDNFDGINKLLDQLTGYANENK